MAQAPTRIQICGRVRARLGAGPIPVELPGRQGRALFVYLVLNRDRVVIREELLEALWPPTNRPPAAVAALSALLSKLRRVLGRETIEGRGELRLALGSEAWVDLEAARHALHRAESAIARSEWVEAWAPSRIALHTSNRGFLAGFEGEWIDEVRRELDEMRLRTLECAAEAGLGMGGAELAAAERSGRRLIEASPFRESGYRYLIEALARRDNVAEAIGVYDDLRVRLRDELGIAPGEATQALHRRLLTAR